MQFNSKMGYSGNEQDYQLIKASLGKLKLQKDLLRYLTNVLPNPTDVVILDNAQNTVKSVKAQLANKNLIPYPYAETQSTIYGISIAYGEDGSIIFNGTATGNVYFKVFERVKFPAGKYYLSGTPAEGGVGVAFLYFFETDNPNKTYNAYTTNGVSCSLSGTEYSGRIYIANGQTVENLVFKPQLELGTTATAYTPYFSDFSTVKVSRCGKNLIPYPYYETTKTQNGVTFTDNGDGSITVNGTASSASVFQFYSSVGGSKPMNLANRTITISGCPSGGSLQSYFLLFSYGGNSYQDFGNGITKTPNADITAVQLRIAAGATINNLTFRPQIELGTTATDYEPYKGAEYTPTADGTVNGITVLTPTTTIINDKGLLFTKVIGDDFNYIS